MITADLETKGIYCLMVFSKQTQSILWILTIVCKVSVCIEVQCLPVSGLDVVLWLRVAASTVAAYAPNTALLLLVMADL